MTVRPAKRRLAPGELSAPFARAPEPTRRSPAPESGWTLGLIPSTLRRGDAATGPVPAPLWRRCGAWLTDAVLIMTVGTVLGSVWRVTSRRRVVEWSGPIGHQVMRRVSVTATSPQPLVRPLVYTVIAAYLIGTTAVYGRTMGKRWFGVRVLRDDLTPAGWSRTLIRYGVAFAPWYVGLIPGVSPWIRGWAAPVLLVVLFVSVVIDPRGRGLHDRAAGTMVVTACWP